MIGVGASVNYNKQAMEADATTGDWSWSGTTAPNGFKTGSNQSNTINNLAFTTTVTYSADGWALSSNNGKTTASFTTTSYAYHVDSIAIGWATNSKKKVTWNAKVGDSDVQSEEVGNTSGTDSGTLVFDNWSDDDGTIRIYTSSPTGGYKITSLAINAKADIPPKTIQANSVDIKIGSSTVSDPYEPAIPYNLGETLTLTAEVHYQDGDDYQEGDGDVSWSSSNTGIATINGSGVVTFVGKGTATITATAEDEGLNGATVSSSFELNLNNATTIPGTIYDPYTVDEAFDAIDAGDGINGVYATGFVSQIVTAYSSQYSNITFNISSDGETTGNQLQAYRCGGAEAANIAVGNLVVIHGNLKKHNTTYEFDTGCSVISRSIPKYTVTYNENGATSGTVPVDNTEYNRNAQVTFASNTGNLQKTGYTFNGWNTKADPTANGAVHYNVGAQIQIKENIVLYAEWLSNSPSITVQANFSGYTGQELNLEFTYGNIADDTKISVVASDNKITVTELIVDGGEGVVTIAFNTVGNSSLSFKNNGVELATCSVTINQSVMTITGLPSKGKVQIDGTLNLGTQVTITNSGIYSSDVIWETSDSNIATVSQSGVVTGKAVGQVTITVTSLDKDDVHQSCVVNVYKGPVNNAIDLSTATYDAASDELVTWTCDYATMENTIGTGTTKPNNYLGGANSSSRMYKNNVMTITPSNGYIIAYVEFDATTSGYATALKNSTWNNASATVNNLLVTVTPTDGSAAFGATIGGTCGFTEVRFYITPKSLLKPASTIKTISGVESNEGATVENVALRFGGIIPVSTWNTINSNWAITDYGVMFARGSMLTARSLETLEAVFRNDADDVAMVHRGSVGTPNANGDNYVFTARLNLEEADYDEVFYAAPFIVAGGEYYFLPEMHYSVRTLAEECYNNGGSSLSQTALATLKGNN